MTLRRTVAPFIVVATVLAIGSPPTTKADDCSSSLQALADEAEAYTTVAVPACLYREQVIVRKPLTLDGQGVAEIRGSDVWASWTSSGTAWVSAKTVPLLGDERPFLSDDRCGSARPAACVYREQAFIDGRPLTLVAPGSTPGSGQFALDSQRHVILGDDPSGHQVEVTTRSRWIVTVSNEVTIRGFSMRHAGTAFQYGGLTNDGFSDWTVEDNTLSLVHSSPVALRAGKRLAVRRNDLSGGGEMGISGGQVVGATIEGNRIHDNGYLTNPGWGAAGVKFGGVRDVSMSGNEVYNNPFGLWCDVHCSNWTVNGNRVHDNGYAGIYFEISDGATISGNTVWANGSKWRSWVWGAGILVQSSANAEVSGNTVAWNYAGISVVALTRSDRPPSLTGTAVHDNVVVREIVAGDFWANQLLATVDDKTGADIAAAAPRFAGNAVWADKPEPPNTPVRFTLSNVAWSKLSTFMARTGDTTSRYLSSSEAYAVLSNAGVTTGVVPAPPTPTPTVTPTATATSTSTPTPTATPTPTPLPTNTPTATPTPSCYAHVRSGDREEWVLQPSVALCGN